MWLCMWSVWTSDFLSPDMTNLTFPMFALTSLSLTLQISLFVCKSHFPYDLLPTSELCLSGQMSAPTRFCFLFLPLPSSASSPSLTHPTSSSPALLLLSPLASGVDLRLVSFAFRLEVPGLSLPGLSSRMFLLQIQTQPPTPEFNLWLCLSRAADPQAPGSLHNMGATFTRDWAMLLARGGITTYSVFWKLLCSAFVVLYKAAHFSSKISSLSEVCSSSPSALWLGQPCQLHFPSKVTIPFFFISLYE